MKGLIMFDLEDTKPSNVFSKTIAQQHEFYLSGEITEPEDYIEWLDVIRSASDQDTVKIYINSPGGNVDTAIQFMQVLKSTSAYVICSVEGACMSAATMIFLSADELEICDHALFMFHNYAGGAFGKGGEIYDQIQFERSWSRKLLESVYKEFLTPTEITQMLENKDIWMDSEEVRKRVKAIQDNLINLRKKENNEKD
jgi:ATP-dependent protease ClpP protease subunit